MDPMTPDPRPSNAAASEPPVEGDRPGVPAPLEVSASPDARRPLPPPDDPVLALLRQPTQDLAGLERMLLAWAVHPRGAAFGRVRLLAWSPARELLVGRLWWEREREAAEPWASMLRAQHLANDGPAPERTHQLRLLALRPDRLTGVAAQAWRDGSVAIGAETRASEPSSPASPHGAVVVTRAGRPLGLMIGEWDEPGDPALRREALEHLCALAAAALDAQVGRDDLARRARHAAAIAEFARAGTSPRNLTELFDLAARLAVQTTGARGGALWIASESGSLDLRATHGPLGTRERLARAFDGFATAAIERARPMVLDRVVDEPNLSPDVAAQLQSLAVFPLLAYGRGAGALAVYDRVSQHPADSAAFDRLDLEFLATLADLVALAEDQARRCEGLRSAEQRLGEAQQQLARNERLAALGEMAARVAHEVRNPLASIGAFARRVHRDLAPDDPSREYLDIVIREAERLERMVGEQLQYATLQRPRLQLESLNAVMQEALQAAGERLVRRRVRLLKKLTPDLPALLLDAERIRRVIGNILDNALESVSPGGRVRVESRRSGSFVVVDIANDGPREPGDLMERLFVPFALSRQGGPGVGLAVAQQVLKLHGGEMRVRGEGEWSTVFSFTLPIPENQDRRRPGLDRRHTRADRRERFPAG